MFVLIIFGIWIEKYDLFKKPNDLAKRIYENLYGKVISEFYENEKIIIDIDYKNFNKIKLSQKKALIQALKNKKISFREFEINKSNESTLGELFGYFMLETVFLGKVLGIDPYNQPAVEEVKILTKKNLI